MSSPYDAIFANDLDMMNQGEFADEEPVVLTTSDGSEVEFSAVIDRKPPTVIVGMGGPEKRQGPCYELWISANVMAQLAPLRAPKKDSDRLKFSSAVGEDPVDHVIIAILAQDAGGWQVRCR